MILNKQIQSSASVEDLSDTQIQAGEKITVACSNSAVQNIESVIKLGAKIVLYAGGAYMVYRNKDEIMKNVEGLFK